MELEIQTTRCESDALVYRRVSQVTPQAVKRLTNQQQSQIFCFTVQESVQHATFAELVHLQFGPQIMKPRSHHINRDDLTLAIVWVLRDIITRIYGSCPHYISHIATNHVLLRHELCHSHEFHVFCLPQAHEIKQLLLMLSVPACALGSGPDPQWICSRSKISSCGI